MAEVTAVIPAYNEAGRIGRILAVLAQVGELRQILVVDDGSKDATSAEVMQAKGNDARIRLLRFPENQGKGQAVLAAVSIASTPYILMLDADLVNLTPDHIHDLMGPVLRGTADMTLGLFWGGRIGTDLSHQATPWLTGQRCLRAEIFRFLRKEAAAGYGLEMALTVLAQKRALRVRHVTLQGVWHPPSEFHRGLWNGFLWHNRMYVQIWRGWVASDGPQALRIQILRSVRRFRQDPLRSWPAARKRLTRLKE